MNVEKKYKKNFLKKFKAPNIQNQISSQIEFSERKSFMNKKILFASIAGVSVVAASVVTICVVKNANIVQEANALVSVDVNPSVELVVDKNNKVMSVRGDNDEGKMIVYEEDLVDKDLKEALEIIIKVENESGYLLNGNVTVDQNNIKISISSDKEAYDQLVNDVKSYISDACEKFNITSTIKEINKYTRSELEEYVLKQDPSLKKEDVQNMSMEQLLKYIAAYQLERSSIYSEQLEYYYNQAKNSKINLTENEVIKNSLSSFSSLVYKATIEAYNLAYNTISSFYTELDEAIYDNLVSEESPYQKAYKKVIEAKNEVIVLKNKINESGEDGLITETLKAQLNAAELTLNSLESTLNSYKESATTSIEYIKDKLQKALDYLNKIKDELKSEEEINAYLTSKTASFEEEINKTKDQFFEDFENAHGEDIKKAKEEIEKRKQELINNLKKN